jgi:hypothetical protein
VLRIQRTAKGLERSFDLFSLNPANDKYDARATILVGPFGKMNRGMHQVLHAVDSNRVINSAQTQDPFDSENAATMAIQQHGQPETKGSPVNLFIKNDAEGMNIGVFRAAVICVRVAFLLIGRSQILDPSSGFPVRADTV